MLLGLYIVIVAFKHSSFPVFIDLPMSIGLVDWAKSPAVEYWSAESLSASLCFAWNCVVVFVIPYELPLFVEPSKWKFWPEDELWTLIHFKT